MNANKKHTSFIQSMMQRSEKLVALQAIADRINDAKADFRKRMDDGRKSVIDSDWLLTLVDKSVVISDYNGFMKPALTVDDFNDFLYNNLISGALAMSFMESELLSTHPITPRRVLIMKYLLTLDALCAGEGSSFGSYVHVDAISGFISDVDSGLPVEYAYESMLALHTGFPASPEDYLDKVDEYNIRSLRERRRNAYYSHSRVDLRNAVSNVIRDNPVLNGLCWVVRG